MKKHLFRGLAFVIILFFVFTSTEIQPIQAQPEDTWWNEGWPYRIAVQINQSGPTSVHLNFSQLFTDLGLVDALLDLQSIRVIPMISGVPGDPVSYQETYSTLFVDGETLNFDPSTGDPFWYASAPFDLSQDSHQFTEGSYAIKSALDILSLEHIQSDFLYNFNGNSPSNWSQYESLTYDLWAEVNDSALDQSPDLFQFELIGLNGCSEAQLNAPALALNQWNNVSISLNPYGECPTPDMSTLEGINFTFGLNLYTDDLNKYDIGDQVSLWLDNFRLIDQDGDGEIRWNAEPGIDTYYIYFDTINHSGHESPTLADITENENPAVVSGAVEAGGYFHQIASAEPADLTLWTAPITEKILKGQLAPVTQNHLTIKAAKGESEALQIIVQSPTSSDLPVRVSDLTHESGIIPASAIDIFRVDYVTLTKLSDEYGRLTDWPDPLYPISQGQEVSFPANTNQPLWFRVNIPTDIPPGDYYGEIYIGEATLPYTLTVYDFTISEFTILPFAAGLDMNTMLEAYGGLVSGELHPCSENITAAIQDTLKTYYITPLLPETEPAPGQVYSLTDYPQQKAHESQAQTNEIIWWSFDSQDKPPFANPAIIDRPGQDARILPWMAWMNRVDGLYHHHLNDWSLNPWETPNVNFPANGDGFLFYPPNDDTLGYNPCDPRSNRLIPSIRLELLRDGLEDYAYLRLLNGTASAVEQSNPSDTLAAQILSSRALYQHLPTKYDNLRFELASKIIALQQDIYIPFFTY
ncbi:DUF4091 domain-containing protein [Chloroflexota bacterium]|nr:DUF4091 domain-containing protein [Chloroflexota bacterium]